MNIYVVCTILFTDKMQAHHKLDRTVNNGWVYCKICKVIYSLPQVGMLTHTRTYLGSEISRFSTIKFHTGLVDAQNLPYSTLPHR